MADAVHFMDPHSSGRPDAVQERLKSAAGIAGGWRVIHRPKSSSPFVGWIRTASYSLMDLNTRLDKIRVGNASFDSAPEQIRTARLELRAHRRNLRSALVAISGQVKVIPRLPRAIYSGAQEEPRVAALVRMYFEATSDVFAPSTFRYFVRTLQEHDPLTLDELWSLSSFLRFALLESLLRDGRLVMRSRWPERVPELATRLQSLLKIHQEDWTTLIEPLITFDKWLNQDPAGAYAAMDFESRQRYRRRVALIALHSDFDEGEVAQAALDLAMRSSKGTFANPRERNRRIHVGYYLVDEGFSRLSRMAGYHPGLWRRALQVVRHYAEDFYIGGILILSFILLAFVIFPLLPQFALITPIILACLLLLPPAMQIAADLANQAITMSYEPEALPKLDFSKGIPSKSATLVVVPSLLLNEKQVHELVENLEVRYLANRDPHLHFALLTDLPDSTTKPHDNDADPNLALAIRQIEELNAKYEAEHDGSFLLLHRHRIYNKRQGVWMSWERKRGKLLDLNKLLTEEFDAFPVKAGPTELLKEIRYILTLDSDTQLPHGSAARLVGAISHPLNQAVIDPKLQIVTKGYGILQPRVGIAVQSTVRSRLAAIFSGQTGFDIYTRATSDAYQDLFGEGIFTGKGIYEVETFHAVLNHRFPRNSLLSHDLIEGAYVRAGLANDIEVIDDYPSHYSAFSRRQHRWIRGDWQIAQWLFSSVPDEFGQLGPNPISAISRWKIFDNLRRSLVDPALVALFVAGWLGLPGGALYWTIAALLLTILPDGIPFAFSLARAVANGSKAELIDTMAELGRTITLMALRLVLLLHRTMLIIDAVVRSLFRRFVTGERLLEWETAAQAEAESARRAPVDRYLTVVSLVVFCLAAAILLFSSRHHALYFAAPILTAWALSSFVSVWLNRAPRTSWSIRRADVEFLHKHALRTWRYFQEFSSARHHFLVPDNVEENGLSEAARVSPTNIGLLLNARQAACELGYSTSPEFAALTTASLSTILRLEKFRGHLYNWYETETLKPLGHPLFVSTVDSGNFVASLYTLRTGVRELRRRPLIGSRLFSSLAIHLHIAQQEKILPAELRHLSPPERSASVKAWLEWLSSIGTGLSSARASWTDEDDRSWWLKSLLSRAEAVDALVRDYLPWMLPEYQPLHSSLKLNADDLRRSLKIDDAIVLCNDLHLRLTDFLVNHDNDDPSRSLAQKLRDTLPVACTNLRGLGDSLRSIERDAEALANATDFSFLVNRNLHVLTVGYNVPENLLDNGCYDLFASEARIATLIAIARGDLRQESWFTLEREHTRAFDQFVALSWTGTMFEYLMPALWMPSFRGTLAARNEAAAVHAQRAFAKSLKIPWGISESGRAQRNDMGHYGYYAFGIPKLAISQDANAGPVISPYSTFLALGTDPKHSLQNLRRMQSAGWIGAYGFYESADYSQSLRSPQLVRQWMAHHLGMSLLAITNLLGDDIFPHWFHSTPIIHGVELLLHEKPVSIATLKAQSKKLVHV